MKKLLIFNWKMAPESLKKAKKLFLDYGLRTTDYGKNFEIIVCPPFVYLSELSSVVDSWSSVKLASQDVFYENSGAYTGEISPKMLKNLGVEYVIIGHSERRKYLNETDEMINKKVLSALKSGLKVILCIGEPERATSDKRQATSDKRQATRKAKNFIKKQLEKDLKNLSLNPKSYILNSRLIIAYEPIWAIGTGQACPQEDAVEMIKFIKQVLNSIFYILNPRVLYGGSVDSKNIANFFKHPEIDGALIGGASLKAVEVKRIIEITKKIV
ncbi:MAG: triose-phosphate isomerase [Patescibacteria group bacterium]